MSSLCCLWWRDVTAATSVRCGVC